MHRRRIVDGRSDTVSLEMLGELISMLRTHRVLVVHVDGTRPFGRQRQAVDVVQHPPVGVGVAATGVVPC